MKKIKLIKKSILLFFCILVLSKTVHIIGAIDIINTNKKYIYVNQELEANYFGVLIGIIKDVHRFNNKDYITCQAVKVYYNGTVIILPPHAIDELKGWLFSGEIKILRPYIGILTQHFICAYICADSKVFYS